MDATNIIIGIFTVLAFIGVYGFLRKRVAEQDMSERIKSLGKQANSNTASQIERQFKGDDHQGGLSELFDVTAGLGISEYKTLFIQAGWGTKNAQRNALLIKFMLSTVAMLAAVLAINFSKLLQRQSGLIQMLLVIGAGLFGYLMFERFMRFIINRRYERISKDLHSAVELLVVCSRAGMGIEKSLERVAQEVSQYNADLGREFMQTAIELEIMPNRKVAYENLRQRINLPLIHGMTMTLVQAEEQGSSVSDSLRVLSDEFRTQVLMNFERRAAKLPATLSIPVVLFTLPTLMAVILGPAIIKLMKNTNIF